MPTFEEHEGLRIDWVMAATGLVIWPSIFMSIPPSEWNSASSWWKYAAVMVWYAIPGHTLYGRRYFYPYQKYLPDRTPPLKEHSGLTKNMTLVRWGGYNTWNYVNYTFFVSGMLSWQWSYTNGPVTGIENAVFWTNFLFAVLCGGSFARHGWYQPLIPLCLVPGMQLIALAKG